MQKVILAFGLKPQPGRGPKFKFAIVKDGTNLNAPIPPDKVLFSGCEENIKEDIIRCILKAKAKITGEMEIVSVMNGYYVSQSTGILSPIQPVENGLRKNINKVFGTSQLREENSMFQATASN